MTKTLSEQLCEICGIKPYNYLVDYAGNYEPFETLDEAEKFSKKHGNAPLELNYYDFENPKNFMKLFNLEFEEQETITDWLNCKYNFKDTESYLNSLICFIKNDYGFITDKTINKVKQAIMQGEWEY